MRLVPVTSTSNLGIKLAFNNILSDANKKTEEGSKIRKFLIYWLIKHELEAFFVTQILRNCNNKLLEIILKAKVCEDKIKYYCIFLQNDFANIFAMILWPLMYHY